MERANAEALFQVRGSLVAERFRQGLGLERRVAVGVSDVRHLHFELFFEREIEKFPCRVPRPVDDLARHAVPDNREEPGLAADFIHALGKLQLRTVGPGGRGAPREMRNINHGKFKHGASSPGWRVSQLPGPNFVLFEP